MDENLCRGSLISLGFKEDEDDCLIYEYVNKYDTRYLMIYEGYAYVLYQLHGVEKVAIQDFRSESEFTSFFKILSRNSYCD